MSALRTVTAAVPAAAALVLPEGCVSTAENGRLIVIGRALVAVGLSPAVFLFAQARRRNPLREELAKYLRGRGATVLPLAIDFHWQRRWLDQIEVLTWVWVKCFLEEGLRVGRELALPQLGCPIAVLPLGNLAGGEREFWQQALLVTNALATEHPAPFAALRPTLWAVAQAWEQHWNATVAHRQALEAQYPGSGHGSPIKADEAFRNMVTAHLVSDGYRLTPELLARLL